jgi:hypothetical protein
MNSLSNQPWYCDGLRFACEQCGGCCSGAPGYVFVTGEEIGKIAAFLGRPGKGLTKEHLRRVGIRHSLTEDSRTGDCCFLQRRDGRLSCRIYPVRPLQCRTWPFWESNLRSPDHWASAADGCPGINQGPHFAFVQIQIRRNARRWEDLPECLPH